MPTPLPLTRGAFFFDNSLLENYLGCPFKMEAANLQCRIAIGGRTALSFGSAIHLILDYRYSRFGSDLDNASIVQCEDGQRQLLELHFAENPVGEGEWRNLNWAIELSRAYNQRYTVEPFNLVTVDGKPVVERPFAIPFLAYNEINGTTRRINSLEEVNPWEIPIIFTGKIDMAVLYNSGIFPWDHKTDSQLGESYHDKMRIRPQFMGYSWAWWKITGVAPQGFFVNGIRSKDKPAKPPIGGWGTWWSASFHRVIEYIDQAALVDWEENTHLVLDTLFWHQRRGIFPRNKNHCGAFGKCEFYNVCYGAPTDRQALLDGSMFTHNDWSPINERKPLFEKVIV